MFEVLVGCMMCTFRVEEYQGVKVLVLISEYQYF